MPSRADCTKILETYRERGQEYTREHWLPEDRATLEAWEAAELARKADERAAWEAQQQAKREMATLAAAEPPKTEP